MLGLKKNIVIAGSSSPFSLILHKYLKSKANLIIIGRKKIYNHKFIYWDIKNYKKLNLKNISSIDFIIYLAHDKSDTSLSDNNRNINAFDYLTQSIKMISQNVKILFFSSHTIFNQNFLDYPYSYLKSKIETKLSKNDCIFRIGLIYGIENDPKINKFNLSKIFNLHFIPKNINNLQPIHYKDLLKNIDDLILKKKLFKTKNNFLNTHPINLKNFLEFLSKNKTTYISIPNSITFIFINLLKVFRSDLYLEISSLTNLNYIKPDIQNIKYTKPLIKFSQKNVWLSLFEILKKNTFKEKDLIIIKKHFFEVSKSNDIRKLYLFYNYGFKKN